MMGRKEAAFIWVVVALSVVWILIEMRRSGVANTCRPDDTTCLAPGETMTIVPNLSAEVGRANAAGNIVWGGEPGKAITFKACAKGFTPPGDPIPPGELRIYANMLVFNEGNGKLSCAKVK